MRKNSMSERLFGCHVSCAGGFANAVRNGQELGVNAIQLHPSPPQRWNREPYPEGYESEFLELLPSSGIRSVVFHAIYLINLASADDEKHSKAQDSLVYYLDLMNRIGGDGVVVHVGSMKDFKDEDAGYERIIGAIDNVMQRADDGARLILEVAAGSGKIIGANMGELKRIHDGLKDSSRVGYGLDTQHMWASGYDFQNQLEEIVTDIENIFGLSKVWCVHLNDSKVELNSKRDRHENIGDGMIGQEALTAFLNHPKLSSLPFVLETPALKEMGTALQEVNKVKQLLH